MPERQKGKRIEGNALESIMRDVLDGMLGFTRDSIIHCKTGDMEIIAVEKPQQPERHCASIIPFPGRKPENSGG